VTEACYLKRRPSITIYHSSAFWQSLSPPLRNAFHKRLRVHSVVQSWIKRDWIRANKPAVSWPSLALISERASLPRLGHYLSMIHLLIPIDSGNTREARTKISRCSKYFDISQLVHAI